MKSADLLCTTKQPKWEEIIPLYEKVIKNYLRKDMLRSSAKALMLKCVLCLLAFDDIVGAKKRFAWFSGEDPSLGPSREGEFLSGVLLAKEDSNKELFTKTVKSHT